MREPREFQVISCFDCGFTGNRVNESEDQLQDGTPFTDHLCPECGESCGPWFKVREVLPSDPDSPEG